MQQRHRHWQKPWGRSSKLLQVGYGEECWLSGTEHIISEEVRKRNGEEKSILRTIQQRKQNWLGHVLRHDGGWHAANNFGGKNNGQKTERTQKNTDDWWHCGKGDRRQWMWEASSRLSLTLVFASHTPRANALGVHYTNLVTNLCIQHMY